MPFTFAHPAAVLPFRRLCPSFLNFPALVVGSMAPDAGYYLHNWQWAVLGHSFAGSLTFDAPAGLIFLALFYLSLRPVAALLPEPHKKTILSWCAPMRCPSLVQLAVATFSIILGSWTHIIWDGFTHANGWCVRNLAALTPTVFTIGSYHVTVWHLLQHASTIFGFVVLWQAYHAQVEKHEPVSSVQQRTDRLAVSIVLILPAVFACLLSGTVFRSGVNMFNLASFAYSAAVRYVDFLLPSLVFAGVSVSIYRVLVQLRPTRLLFAPPVGFSKIIVLAEPQSDAAPHLQVTEPMMVPADGNFAAGTVSPPVA